MADYYPLIARAVAGLERNNGENRRALYERARAALLTQLRSVTPALDETDITRERLALEESIRKVEAESARQFVDSSRQPPAPKARPAEPRPAEARQWNEPPPPPSRPREPRAAEPRQWDEAEPSSPPRRYVNPPAQEPRADSARRPRPPSPPPPPTLPDTRQSNSIFDRPLAADAQPPAAPLPPRHPLRRPPGEQRSLSDSGLQDFRDVVAEANELGGASARAEKSARDAYAAMPATDVDRPPDRSQRSYDRSQYERSEPRMLEPTAPQERMFDLTTAHDPHQDFSEPMLESSFAIDDARPLAPKARRAPPAAEDEMDYADEEVRERRSYRDLLPVIIAAVAITAIVGGLVWLWPSMVSLYGRLRAPAVEIARDAPPPVATRQKIPDRLESSTPQTSPAPTPSTTQPPGAAVAQKVVLYEEDPADPNGKRFVGSAIWRTETVTPGPGQPPELAIRADVDIPERKLAMTWSLRRNTDKSLPASHTIEIMFKLPVDFPSGGISGVPGILMKQAESTRGVPLAGLAVKVTNGFYLIGLSNQDTDRDRNLQLLKERGWFDIPVVYNNNRRAILALEKGTPGDRAFTEAFKAWKQ
jgi:hypothetical protein